MAGTDYEATETRMYSYTENGINIFGKAYHSRSTQLTCG